LRGKLETEGIASEIVGPDGLGAVEDLAPLIWIAVGAVIDHEIYPRIRQILVEWFTENPAPRHQRLRVGIYDRGTKTVVEEFELWRDD